MQLLVLKILKCINNLEMLELNTQKYYKDEILQFTKNVGLICAFAGHAMYVC